MKEATAAVEKKESKKNLNKPEERRKKNYKSFIKNAQQLSTMNKKTEDMVMEKNSN